jgi:hypothetical protein
MLRRMAIAAIFAMLALVNVFLFYALLVRRDLLPLAFAVTGLVALLWIVGHSVASLVFRIRTGRFVFPPRFPDALHCESWISGVGPQRVLFLRPGASQCLWVVVLRERLLVGAVFPFNLFPPEWMGFEYDIPSNRIISVTERRPSVGRARVAIRFRSDDGAEVEFELSVRDVKRFSTALGQMSKTLEDPKQFGGV